MNTLSSNQSAIQFRPQIEGLFHRRFHDGKQALTDYLRIHLSDPAIEIVLKRSVESGTHYFILTGSQSETLQAFKAEWERYLQAAGWAHIITEILLVGASSDLPEDLEEVLCP